MNQTHFEEVKKRLLELKSLLPTSLIVPSILTNDLTLFETQFEVYISLFKLIEIDILDNTLIKNQTVSIEDSLNIAKKYLSKEKATNKIALHIMSSTFSYELVKSNLSLIGEIIVSHDLMKSNSACFDSFASLTLTNNKAFKFGVYFSPSINVSDYKDEVNLFDFIQIMTVVPGKQGNIFIPEALDAIPSLKAKGYKVKVDGGISPELVKSLSPQRQSILKTVDSVSIGSYFSEIFNSTSK